MDALRPSSTSPHNGTRGRNCKGRNPSSEMRLGVDLCWVLRYIPGINAIGSDSDGGDRYRYIDI